MAAVGGGPLSSKVCILSGEPPAAATLSSGEPFYGFEKEFLHRNLLRTGNHPNDIRFHVIGYHKGPPTQEELDRSLDALNIMPDLRVIVPLDPVALKLITGKSSLEKWHLSPMDTLHTVRCSKAVPTFHPNRIAKEMGHQLYVVRAFIRAREGAAYTGPWKRKPRNFYVNPKYEETMDILLMLKGKDVLANDIETGSGVINTVGFAWSPNDAIAIQTLPDRLGAEKFLAIWKAIAALLEDKKIGKVYQNLSYEAMYYSMYGIRCENYYWDTMWAQRLLYPEHKIGLDNVGRLYTYEPYWKDIGKDYKDEGGKRDWNNIKDWPAHFKYNLLDTTGTFEAYENQKKDLIDRKKLNFFTNYMMKLAPPIVEMCSRGLPVNIETQTKLKNSLSTEVKELTGELSEEINPKSWKQKLTLLKSKGYKIPKKRVAGKWQESTDELSLKKLRLKYPDDRDIQILLRLSGLNKGLGSYVNIGIHKDKHVRFMINGAGTETLRFNSSKDPWDKGFNAQTIPSQYKVLFDADPSYTWLQIDLKQAESRFVAYDSCDLKLIEMLEDSSKDIHKFVASHIYGKPESDITKGERQLGKKSGHGANYAMQANTFMGSCLKEEDVVLTKFEAENILSTYHRLFPGISNWHREIRETLYRCRELVNPLGFSRLFYGRMDDNTFREAYAFKPQSTIPIIVNHLMLYLLKQRDKGSIDFRLHLQCHDSILLMCRDNVEYRSDIAKICYDLKWHPSIILPAGELKIPCSIEYGVNLGNLKELQL